MKRSRNVLFPFLTMSLTFVASSGFAQFNNLVPKSSDILNLFSRRTTPPGSENYTRLSAKNRAKVYLIYSGSETRRIVEEIKDAIENHPDYPKKKINGEETKDLTKVQLVSLTELEAKSKEKGFKDQTRFFFLVGTEMDEIPACLSDLLPSGMKKLSFRKMMVQGTQSGDAGSLHFNAAFFAPTSPYLKGMQDRFTTVTGGRWSDVKFDLDQIPIRRVLIFSEEKDRKTVEDWGFVTKNSPSAQEEVSRIESMYRRQANSLPLRDFEPEAEKKREEYHPTTELPKNAIREWHSLNELTSLPANYLRGTDIALFVNRSNKNGIVPSEVQAIVGNRPMDDLVSIVNKKDESKTEAEKTVSIFDVPTQLMLRGKAYLYPSPDFVPADIVRTTESNRMEVAKLPLYIATPLVINREQKQQIRTSLIQTFNDLGMTMNNAFDENLDRELQEKLAANEGTRSLPSQTPRYLLIFEPIEWKGNTAFLPLEIAPSNRITSPPVLPDKPVDKNDNSKSGRATWKEVQAKYENDLAHYRIDINNYYTQKVRWERILYRYESARVKGILKLVDKSDSSRPVWSHTLEIVSTIKSEHKRDSVDVPHSETPQGISDDPAVNKNDCSVEIKMQVAEEVARGCLGYLMAENRLPTETEVSQQASAGKNKGITDNVPKGMRVVSHDNENVFVDFAGHPKIKVGTVLLLMKKKVLPDRTITVPWFRVRVASIDKETAICVPVSPTDLKLFSQVPEDAPVTLPSATPAPPQNGGNKPKSKKK